MNLTQSTKLDEDNLPENISDLLDMAVTDYDTFWAALDNRDREITSTLTGDDNYDAVVVDDGDIYGFWYNELTDSFDVWHLCSESELKVYVNEVNSSLNESQLDDFIAELKNDLPGLEIIKTNDDRMSFDAQFLSDNECISKAWESALEVMCAAVVE